MKFLFQSQQQEKKGEQREGNPIPHICFYRINQYRMNNMHDVDQANDDDDGHKKNKQTTTINIAVPIIGNPSARTRFPCNNNIIYLLIL